MNRKMFCLRKGIKTDQKIENSPLSVSAVVHSAEERLADNNASFLRAARAGNLEKVHEFLKGSIDINISNANGLNALHLSAKEGHVNVVTELLKKGANVNAATKKGNTALHIASLAGQEEVVKVLSNLGANVNVQSQNGFTPLYMAAQENHDMVVSFLLANGANQSLATEDGFTPLAVALQQGHDKVVAVLLENDTKGRVRLPALHIAAKKDDCKAATLLLQNDHNPDVTSKSGFTPLHIAAHYGNSKIANILLAKGADVNYAAKHQITPLHVASKWGKSNMVDLLVEKGAKIESVTRDGLTPLHCAARSGHEQVVDLLLEKGAPILAKTKNGLAPLHMASQGDHVDSARILLYHKAPVDDVTVDYLTALHVAAHCGHVKVAKLLLDRKADPNARALNGFTPLHIACKKNRIKVVELLLKHGASIEATTESGLSPLHVASFMGCMNIVIYLIQSGANPDVPTVRGETPLHLAARANQIDIIRILLRNGANVDTRAREEQTPLHIAARLGNVDIVSLLLQHGAAVDAITKDMYTALHIASKEGQEEVVSVLLDHEASLTSATKRGFTPLHLAAKYGNIKVVQLLLQKDAPVDAQGKNGLTPLHVAAHYNHINEALLLLEKGASPHGAAKNGFTPLHIAAKKNQMDIATTLLEYGAKCNAESKAGYTPLHLSSQEGHTDMTTLLIEHQANVNQKANNGLTPLHLSAQEDRVNVASVLVKNGAEIGPQTCAGYTPLHVASHFGQTNMVRFLLQNNADVHEATEHGYTPLHQAAQQGHTSVVNVLLENKASPNSLTLNGQTALSIAQRLGYISVVETLKVVTETIVTTTTTNITEEKYKVVAPEIMQEIFMTDSEDEGGEDTMLGDQSYRYLTADEMKSLGDDSLPIDVTKDEKQHEAIHMTKDSTAPMVEEDKISPQHITPIEFGFSEKFSADNIEISRAPVHAGFLVSFMVDARGGAMRGCRHCGVRVIIPPRKASMPMRITCRYLRREKLSHPPPLMEGEACASRILEVGPVGARFLGPVIIEVPHFASLRGREREVTILRSDTGETWREHTLEASEEAVQDVLNESFEGDEISALEDLNTNRITRILTTDFPQYFAIVTRIRQEVHGVGPEGGIVSSKVVPQVQAIFPEGALQKKIRVGLQAQPLSPELVAKLLGNRVAVSPIVTVEPRRRKFHKPITLTIPVPQAATKGMINQYSGDAPTLRLLCSITGSTKSGGSSKAQWEDVTGSTPFTFVNDCVSFTTTVSARFWLMDCRQVNEVSRYATELYQEAVHVPFMAKFVIFAKRHDNNEAQLRVFCMTDDKEDKTLETQENFTEIAKSRDVEVLEGKLQHLEFAGNLVPVTNSKEQLKFVFHAFHENRLPFTIRVKDPHVEPLGRIAFMREAKVGRGEPPQTPICNLNIAMPQISVIEQVPAILELVTLEKSYDFMQEAGLSKPESIHRANLRLSDISQELEKDWVILAHELRVSETDVNAAKAQHPNDNCQQALAMLRLWLRKYGSKMSGNELEKAILKINREDVINKCIFNVEHVTDDVEKAVAKVHLDQSGFDVFKEELGSSRETSMRRGASLDISYDEQDIMKEAESAAETSSETGSLFEKDQISHSFPEEKESKICRVTKTPPLSPCKSSQDEIKKPTIQLVSEDVLNHRAVVAIRTLNTTLPKMTESGTWPSGEMDTSQVSISSLPYDEKSEPSTTTVSSATPEADAEKNYETKEWTEIDESGTVKHYAQKITRTSKLRIQQKLDDSDDDGVFKDDAFPMIPVSKQHDSDKISPDSPELSFAEKRDFFQKLSQSSSSPTTAQCSLKFSTTTEEFPVSLLGNKELTISNTEMTPEERLSFADRLKFFEKTAESLDFLSDIPHEVKAVKAELWTVIDDKDSIETQTNVKEMKERIEGKRKVVDTSSIIEISNNEKDVSEMEVFIQAHDKKSSISLPLYESKEAYETKANKPEAVSIVKTEVEVLVKELVPGKEALEICSVKELTDTNISDKMSEVMSLAEFKAPIKKKVKKTESIEHLTSDTPTSPESPVLKNTLPTFNKSEGSDHMVTDYGAEKLSSDLDNTKFGKENTGRISDEKMIFTKGITNVSYSGEAEKQNFILKSKREVKGDYPLSPGIDFSFETVQVFSVDQGAVKEVSSPKVTPLHSPDKSVNDDGITAESENVFSTAEQGYLDDETFMHTKIPLTSFSENTFISSNSVQNKGVANVDSCDPKKYMQKSSRKDQSQISDFVVDKSFTIPKDVFDSRFENEFNGSEKHDVSEKSSMNDRKENTLSQTFNKYVTSYESFGESSAINVDDTEIESCPPHEKSPEAENEHVAVPRKSTSSAFKKANTNNLQTWVRESPDCITKIKNTSHTSLGKPEIFMCTEETLDNVKKILSQADAESNIVLPSTDVPSYQTGQDTDVENKDSLEKDAPKSPCCSLGRSESSLSGSLKERSSEINSVEIMPVLEVSDGISDVSVDKTGHEALGMPCLFNKDVLFDISCSDKMEIDALHKASSAVAYEAENSTSDNQENSDALFIIEKADFEDVEKETKKRVTYTKTEHIVSEKTHPVVECPEVSQFNVLSKEKYSVSPDQLRGDVYNSKIQLEKIHQHFKQSKVQKPTTQRLDDFLKLMSQPSEDDHITLPSELGIIDKRTEEWIDQNEILMKTEHTKDGQIHSSDNGLLFEERVITYDDEQHKKSSPTAESFDDEARVEKCDTDVMMQLLDYVSRSEIELAEVRTEDEAPDIEEDVSPSGEEEMNKIPIEDSKCKKEIFDIINKTSTADENLKVEVIAERLLPSPLRSSFDSVTSPSRKDPSENLETTVEIRVANTRILKSMQPQSSLEVEVGSRGSEEGAAYEYDRETFSLADVMEEQQLEMENKNGEVSVLNKVPCTYNSDHGIFEFQDDEAGKLTDAGHLTDVQLTHSVATNETVYIEGHNEMLPPKTTISKPDNKEYHDSTKIISKDINDDCLEISTDITLKSMDSVEVNIDPEYESKKLEISHSPLKDIEEINTSDIALLDSNSLSVCKEVIIEETSNPEIALPVTKISATEPIDELDSKSTEEREEFSHFPVSSANLDKPEEKTGSFDINKEHQKLGSGSDSIIDLDAEIHRYSLKESSSCSRILPTLETDDNVKLMLTSQPSPKEEELPEEHAQIKVASGRETDKDETFTIVESPASGHGAASNFDEKKSIEQQLNNISNIIKSHSSDVWSQNYQIAGNQTDVITKQSGIKSNKYTEGKKKTEIFVPLAFDNTAFMGAEEIDASELPTDRRARSPYEVVRTDKVMSVNLLDQASGCTKPEIIDNNELQFMTFDQYTINNGITSKKIDICSSSESDDSRIYLRKRPILQHIPSEISEEDLIESNISSPTASNDVNQQSIMEESKKNNEKIDHENAKLENQSNVSSTISDEFVKCEFYDTLAVKEKHPLKSDTSAKESKFDLQRSQLIPFKTPSTVTNESQLLKDCRETNIPRYVLKLKNEHENSTHDSACPEVLKTDSMYDKDVLPSAKIYSKSLDNKKNSDRKFFEICETSEGYLHGKTDIKYGVSDSAKNECHEKIANLDSEINSEKNFACPSNDLEVINSIQNKEFQAVAFNGVHPYIASNSQLTGDEKQHLSAISDDDDIEIGKLLNVDIQAEDDIIERPQTPEPPLDLEQFSEDSVNYNLGCKRKNNLKTMKILNIDEQNFKAEQQSDSVKGVLSRRNQFDNISDDGFETIDQSDIDAINATLSEDIIFDSDVPNLRKMGSYKDISTAHLDEVSRELDIGFSSPFLATKVAVGGTDFAYGMQFENDFVDHLEAMDIDTDQLSDDKETVYAYGMRFEREHDLEEGDILSYGDLYTHQEEDEEALDDIDKVKDTVIVKADFDILAGRKFFTKSTELDDISMSSLQEFERLEEEIKSGRRSSIGSVDSLNGKYHPSKSGEHDDVSMNSLTEFEKLEREYSETERMESLVRETNTRLSEIEEGHESQTSEASQETLSDAGRGEYNESFKTGDPKLNDFSDILRRTKSKCENKDSVAYIKLYSPDVKIHYLESENSKHQLFGVSQSSNVLISEINKQGLPSDDVNLQDNEARLDKDAKEEKETLTKNKHAFYAEKKPPTFSENPEKYDDVDQDSLYEDKSMKPDSLSCDDKFDYQDSLREDKSGDLDSLQDIKDEMRDSLHEERLIDEDSLHEMDILPDESSLSLESSIAAILDVSHDSLSEKMNTQPVICDQEFDADSLKRQDLSITLETSIGYVVTTTETGEGIEMVSSTDSLERSSSAATHATYQYETESIMSTSLNSVQTSDDYTMMSSIDTYEQGTNMPYNNFSSDVKLLSKDEKENLIIDSEGNIESPDFKTIMLMKKDLNVLLKLNDKEDLYRSDMVGLQACNTSTEIKGEKKLVSLNQLSQEHGSDGQKDLMFPVHGKFPLEFEEKIETVDKYGNPIIIRKVQKIVNSAYDFESNSTSGGTKEKYKEFLKKHDPDVKIDESNVIIRKEKTADDKDDIVIVKTVQHQITSGPVVHYESFAASAIDPCLQSFRGKLDHLEPTKIFDEYKDVDEDGNFIKVSQENIVTPKARTYTITEPNVPNLIAECIKKCDENDEPSNETSYSASSESQQHPSLYRSRKLSMSSGLPQVLQERVLPLISSDIIVHDSSVADTVQRKIDVFSTEEEIIPEGSNQEVTSDEQNPEKHTSNKQDSEFKKMD